MVIYTTPRKYTIEQILNTYISTMSKRLKNILVRDQRKLSYSKTAAMDALLRVRNYDESDQFHILLSYLIELDEMDFDNLAIRELIFAQYDAIAEIIKIYTSVENGRD